MEIIRNLIWDYKSIKRDQEELKDRIDEFEVVLQNACKTLKAKEKAEFKKELIKAGMDKTWAKILTEK
jgi:hypothetical protein